jgi:transcriptional regulator with XRE-family HTH domain
VPQRLLHTNSAYKNVIGTRLRRMRERHGITHVQMLDLLRAGGWDLDPATLSRIEQGTRTLTDIEILAFLHALGRKWAELDE